MPPTIGAAMRLMTSDPVAADPQDRQQAGHGRDDSHHLRPHAVDGALHHRVVEVGCGWCEPGIRASCLDIFLGIVEVDEHDDAGFRRDSRRGR